MWSSGGSEMALTTAQKKQAQRDRERAANRRTVSLSLPVELIDWLDEEAETLGQSRAERIEGLLRERQEARDA